MAKYDEVLALQLATIDLLSAIQKDKIRLDDEIDAVSEALKRLPNWGIEMYEEVRD